MSVVSPADGLGNVPLNANIDVLFSGPVDPTTVNGTTIQVMGGNQTVVPASISFTNKNQTVMIQPLAPLAPATQMTLTVAGVKDLAGNTVATHTTHFTTGTAPATVSPVVVVANPPISATNVPVNAAISLQAYAPIDPTSINSSTFLLYDRTLNQYLTATYSQSSDGTTVFLLPSTQLAVNRQYTVYFSQEGMTDLAGNLLNGNSINNYSFTTGYAASTSGPQVTGVSPASGVQGVPINAQLTVEFNEPVNAESLGQVSLSEGGNPIAVTKNLSNGNQILTLVPTAALLQNTPYTITVAGVMDLAGNTMPAGFTSTFNTGTAPDFSTPSVVSIIPANQATGVSTSATMQVQFSKLMNRLTITSSTFTVSTNGNKFVQGTISVSTDGTSAVFTPNSPLSATTVYTVQLTNGIADLEGQALTAASTTFTTGTQ